MVQVDDLLERVLKVSHVVVGLVVLSRGSLLFRERVLKVVVNCVVIVNNRLYPGIESISIINRELIRATISLLFSTFSKARRDNIPVVTNRFERTITISDSFVSRRAILLKFNRYLQRVITSFLPACTPSRNTYTAIFRRGEKK